MPNYFGGAPTAFQGGIAAVGEERNRRRRENALSALIDRFGPEAAAPQELGVLEGLAQRREMQPLVMEEATRANEAGRAMAERYGPIAGDPASHATDTSLRQRAMQNAALFLQGATRRGIDPGQAFDRVVPVLRGLNVPAEELAFMRQQVVEDPETVGDLIAMFRGVEGGRALSGGQPMYNDQTGKLEWVIPTEAGPQTLEGYTPATALQAEERLAQGAERNRRGWSQLSWEQAKALLPSAQPGVQHWLDENGRVVADPVPGSPQEFERDAKITEQVATLRTSVQGLRNAHDVSSQSLAEIELAKERIRSLSSDPGRISTVLRSAKSRWDVGSNEWHLKNLLETIAGRNVLQTLENVDSSLYPLSDKDSETLRTALGQLKVSDDPRLLVANLQRIEEIYARAKARAQEILPEAESRIETMQRRREARYGPPVNAPEAAEPSIDDLLQQYGQ